MAGHLGQSFDKLYQEEISETGNGLQKSASSNQKKYRQNVSKLVSDLNKEDFFTIHPNRHFSTFPKFIYHEGITDINKYSLKMKLFSKRLDRLNRVRKEPK